MTKDLKQTRVTARLDRLSAVRLEMARIYRKMKSGKIEAETATKRIYVLRELRATIEAEIGERLEERMVGLQERLDRQQGLTK